MTFIVTIIDIRVSDLSTEGIIIIIMALTLLLLYH